MQQIEHGYRQHSISNNSSIITPKIKKRMIDNNKDSLVFSSILKKQKSKQYHDKQINNDNQDVVSNASQYGSKIDRKITRKQSDQSSSKIKHKNVVTPCQDLFSLFINHKISSEYIQLMQKHKFKNLVIISVILPTQLMKKLSKFIDFSQQYRISIPQTPFSTDFIPLNPNDQQNQANYVFWTYQVSENQQNLRNSINFVGGKNSPTSVRSLRESRNRRVSNIDQYNNNLRNMMVEVSQIVITTKKYIQDHSDLFFPSSAIDMASSTYQQIFGSLHLSQLDIEKTLLYFDEQEINQSTKSIQSPKYMQNSSNLIKQMKIKNPQIQNPSYIEIEPDQEQYDLDDKFKDRVHLVQKGVIDKIQTGRSREIPTINEQVEHNQRLQFFQLLQKESIFKHINYLLPFWIDNESSYQPQEQSFKQSRKRKNSFNRTTLQLEKCHKFKLFLSQEIRSCLKKNFTYSMFCSSWLFLHFVTNFYQNNIASEDKKLSNQPLKHHFSSYSGLLMKSLKTFKKQIQLRFIQRVQNQYKQLIDQGTLRNILRNIKKQEIIFMKKNFNSLVFPSLFNSKSNKNCVFSQQQTLINKEYIAEIQQQILTFMDKLQQEIYYENNKQAIIYNQKILQTEYERIIEDGFRREKLKKKQSVQSNSLDSDERPFINTQSFSRKKISSEIVSSQLQKDFNDFIDAYWTKGIKVSSQLKTFNDFMEKCKKSYLKNINHLTKEKKSQQKEEQQRQNKKRTIKLLQMQIFKLQDKKKEVKQKNELIKKQVKNVQQKIQQQQKDDSRNYRQKSKIGHQRQFRSMNHSLTDKFNRFSDKNKGSFQISGSQEKRFNKTGLSFQIQNKRRSRKSLPKDSGKYSRNQQNFKRSSPSKKGQTIQEVAQQKLKKKRCLNLCCLIM